MANCILSPTMLWGNFDDSLPTPCTVLGETNDGKITVRRLRFFGRAVGGERVNIFALFAFPSQTKKVPALVVMSDVALTADEELVKRFARCGYAVIMPDYRGEWDGVSEYTIYPREISYANYREAGRRMDFADESAKETSWYEWTAVARYCVNYLRTLPQITRIGALGLKIGGDVVWQLAATCSELSCAVPVCSGGWRAYQGINKFSESTELKMNDERYRFLAGVDAQAYAQVVQCPVLMLCSTNDSRFDADRAFDTFARISPDIEKTFYFAARYDGHIGNTGVKDLDLFLDKHLKGRAVFVPSPVDISIEENDGDLVAKIRFDRNGEVKYCDVYMAEDRTESAYRNWTKCRMKRAEGDNEQVFYLNACKGSSRVFAFAKAKYSCGFAVSSKIGFKKIEKDYDNFVDRSRILYSDKYGTDTFTVANCDKNVLAGCFLNTSVAPVETIDGPFGIRGVTSIYGLKSYKLGDEMYRLAENALLKVDIYSPVESEIKISVYRLKDENTEEFSCVLRVAGGEVWSNYILSAKDFKNENKKPLSQLSECVSITFTGEQSFCINNLLWL